MSKYHVNSKTGRAGQCRATKKGCPLGADTPHFETKEEAKSFIEKNEEKNNNKFASVSKKDVSGGSSNNGGGNDKTLVGTPDPEGNSSNEPGKEVNNAIKDIKANADYFIKNGEGDDEAKGGEAEAGEVINRLYEESFENGINEASVKYFKNELSKAAYTASRSYEFTINEKGESSPYEAAKFQALDSALDSIDEAEYKAQKTGPASNNSNDKKSNRDFLKGKSMREHLDQTYLSSAQQLHKYGRVLSNSEHYSTKEEAMKAATAASRNSSSGGKVTAPQQEGDHPVTDFERKELQSFSNLLSNNGRAKIDENDSHATGERDTQLQLSLDLNKMVNYKEPSFEEVSSYKEHIKKQARLNDETLEYLSKDSSLQESHRNERIDYYSGKARAYDNSLEIIEGIQRESVNREIAEAKKNKN